MKLKLPILLFTCLLFSTSKIYSQNCTYNFSGIVSDLHDQSPLSNATILIEGTDNAVVSDSNGYFKFSGLCLGKYSVTVSHLKCKSKTFSIKLDGNIEKNGHEKMGSWKMEQFGKLNKMEKHGQPWLTIVNHG